jgi:hypothetical protein
LRTVVGVVISRSRVGSGELTLWLGRYLHRVRCSGRDHSSQVVHRCDGKGKGKGRAKEGEGEGGGEGKMLVFGALWLAWNHEIVRGSPVAGSRPGDWPAEPSSRPSGVDPEPVEGCANPACSLCAICSGGFMSWEGGDRQQPSEDLRFAGMDV